MLAHCRGDAALSDGRGDRLPTAHPIDTGGLEPTLLLERASEAGSVLASISSESRRRAWRSTLLRLLDPASPARRRLDPVLQASVRLSPRGLQAGLEAIAAGMVGDAADALFRDAAERVETVRAAPALVVLASNLPGLALQPILPALALGRPLVVKSSRQEPHFAPTLLRELARDEPRLAGAFVALTWNPGAPIEPLLLERCDPVLAYGGREALDSLRPRVQGRLIEYGPKISLAVVGADASRDQVRELARDVALFDQRGCLSVQVVVTLAPAREVAEGLAEGLATQATLLPPGPATLAESSAVLAELDLARMRGRTVLGEASGWVIVEAPASPLRGSPGRRFVRVHPVASADELRPLLSPWSGSIQGAAIAGRLDEAVHSLLCEVGVSRVAAAGSLQETDARWHNGGIDPLGVL